MRNKLKILLTGFSILSLLSFQANAVDWPGACGVSLQQCIDAQGDPGTVTVKTNNIITLGTGSAGTLTINKGFTLRAATGYHPILRNAVVDILVDDNKTVTISGFELQQSSVIIADTYSNSELNINNNNWSNPDAGAGRPEGIRVTSNVSSGSESTINIVGNNITGEGTNSAYGFVDVYKTFSADGDLVVSIIDNHISVLDTNPTNEAIYILNYGTAGRLDAGIVANEIRGSTHSIRLYQNNSSGSFNIGIISNLITGVIDAGNVVDINASRSSIYSEITAGSFAGTIGNNTIDGVKRTASIDGIGLNFSNHTTTGSSTLSLLNNIVVNTAQGYVGPATGTATSVTSTGNNIFFHHGTMSGISLIASDLNAPPKFIEEGINYALSSTSPAIDRADSLSTALHYTSVVVDTPMIDADGLRRIKGPKVDSGAYEWGDRHILHRDNDNAGHVSQAIADSDFNSNTDAASIVTQVWNYDNETGVYNDHPIGIYQTGANWHIFNQDGFDMPTDAKFHVFYPYGNNAGDDDLNGLYKWSSAGGTPGLELNDFHLDGDSRQMIFATNLWEGVYNPHPIEVGYLNSGEWYLGNADGVNMQAGAKFMTYDQDPSRNVFRHYVTSENTFGYITLIDHPLLNGNRCALPMVTQGTSWLFAPLFEQNPHNIGVFYQNFSGRWAIFNQDIAPIDIDIGGSPVVGGVFNVMVDPQQVYECNDIIFKNGFD